MLCAIAVANPINPQKALLKARSFVKKKANFEQQDISMAYALNINERGEADVFVYNIGKDNGFVVISGDNDSEEILGYADSGAFDYASMPDNMKAWLDACSVYENVASTRPAKANNVVHPTDVIEPLIRTMWGQHEPYNLLCPEDGGEKCPAGCTATAMAQVMRYHRFPRQQTNAIPAYYVSTLGKTMPELPATTFDWSKMPNTLDENSPQECIDEVAKLMLYCGQAVDMAYAATGSGGATWILPERMPEYFGFPATMHYVYRQAYSEQQWDSLLINELKQNQPVIYTAYNNQRQGHTFICDGYDGNGYYHINWGWKGVGNGYFKVAEAYATDEELNDKIKNYHLSLNQGILVGLKPSGEDTFVMHSETFRAYTRPSLKNGKHYTRKKVSDNFTITLKQSFVNTSETSVKLSHAYGLYSEAGKLVAVANSSSASLGAGASRNYEVASLNFGSSISAGKYTLKAIYKPEGEASWKPMGGTDQNYIDVTIDGLEATLTPVPLADFKVSELAVEDDFLKFTFFNADDDFYGPVYLRKLNAKTNTISQVATDYMMVDAATRYTYHLYVKPEDGFDLENDVFFLSVDEYDSQYFYTNQMQGQRANLEKRVDILNLTEDSTAVVGDRIFCQISLANTSGIDFHDNVNVSLVDNNGKLVYTFNDSILIHQQADTVINLEIPVSDYERSYQIAVNTNISDYAIDTYTTGLFDISKGALYWNKYGEMSAKKAANIFVVPEEALAINLRGAYTSNVTPNGNPNTVYMLDKTMPRGLAGKNYVNNSNKSSTLKLTDGYDYFIPLTMTFTSSATYIRVADDGDGVAWSTISLPFNVNKVTADGTEVEWVKTDDDDTGLWILELDSLYNGVPVFRYAQNMVAGKPYVIGTDSRMAGKKMEFVATKPVITPTLELNYTDTLHNVAFVGTHCSIGKENCFVVDGGKFIRKDHAEVNAFQAYFTLDDAQVDEFNILGSSEEPSLPGDVDGDGAVNVVDVMTMIGYILGDATEVFIFANADADNDGSVNVVDVMTVIDYILNKGS